MKMTVSVDSIQLFILPEPFSEYCLNYFNLPDKKQPKNLYMADETQLALQSFTVGITHFGTLLRIHKNIFQTSINLLNEL